MNHSRNRECCAGGRTLRLAPTTPVVEPEAPTERPETEPRPTTAPPVHKPDLDPFNPPWPAGRPEPQPKA